MAKFISSISGLRICLWLLAFTFLLFSQASLFASNPDNVIKASQKLAPTASKISFDGFYIGFSGSYATQIEAAKCTSDWACGAWAFNSTTLQQPKGFYGALNLGYNYYLQNSFVIGAEVDFSNSYISETSSQYVYYTSNYYYYNSATTYSNISTARLRGGYLVDNSLFFISVGAAYADVTDTFSDTYPSGVVVNYPNGISTTKNAYIGYAIGGGIEYKFDEKWSVKFDYLRIGFPSNTVDIYGELRGTDENGDVFDNFKHDLDIFRVGLNYAF